MTTGVKLDISFRGAGVRTCGSVPCHNLDPARAGFDPLDNLEKRFLPKVGERGVVGDGAVDSLGASSDNSDSGGGDGL